MAKEYIEREKAIEWFMAFVHMGESDIPAETVISDLKYAIPAADVVEVVRCRECKYSHEDEIFGNRWCDSHLGCRKVKDDGYCYLGELKEGAGND